MSSQASQLTPSLCGGVEACSHLLMARSLQVKPKSGLMRAACVPRAQAGLRDRFVLDGQHFVKIEKLPGMLLCARDHRLMHCICEIHSPEAMTP